jgi:glycosyltransferase involved in cell wall biosynthesis
MYPTISIVTASYNQGQFIEETIRSVVDQGYPNLEYIIIDGGSTDQSVEVIKKYAGQLKYWTSERDNGQGHAINKGLQHCSGEIFNWLNSDDYLEPGALLKIANAFENKEVQMVAGNVRNFSASAEEIIANQNLTAEGLLCWEAGVQFVQPGVWMRRELVSRCGGIDQNFHFAFDWDLYIRYLYDFPAVKYLEDLLVNFRLHENSKTQSMLPSFGEEEKQIIEKLGVLPRYGKLKKACSYKIQKTGWTTFLSGVSKSDSVFMEKALKTFTAMGQFPKVSFTRQTAGALKAFWQGREI